MRRSLAPAAKMRCAAAAMADALRELASPKVQARLPGFR
jgi:hypothetical protein